MFLNRKANTFTHDFVRSINKALDQVEQNEGPTALVTVSLSKFFSGGLPAPGKFFYPFLLYSDRFHRVPNGSEASKYGKNATLIYNDTDSLI